jgi:hypothetical protein
VHGTSSTPTPTSICNAPEATGGAYSTITDVSRTRPGTHLPGPAALILLRATSEAWTCPATCHLIEGIADDRERCVEQ